MKNLIHIFLKIQANNVTIDFAILLSLACLHSWGGGEIGKSLSLSLFLSLSLSISYPLFLSFLFLANSLASASIVGGVRVFGKFGQRDLVDK